MHGAFGADMQLTMLNYCSRSLLLPPISVSIIGDVEPGRATEGSPGRKSWDQLKVIYLPFPRGSRPGLPSYVPTGLIQTTEREDVGNSKLKKRPHTRTLLAPRADQDATARREESYDHEMLLARH